MHAAVVEFDSLADTVGSAAKNHHLGAIVRRRFVLALVGRIEVGREGLEFRAAGVDRFEHRHDRGLAPLERHRGFVEARELGDSAIRKAALLGLAQQRRVERTAPDSRLGFDDFGDRVDKPRVDAGQVMDFLARDAQAHRVGEVVKAVAIGQREMGADGGERGRLAHPGRAALEPPRADFQRAQRLLQRFLEGAPDRHRLAHRLHLRAELVGRAAKFLESETRNLGHHVVDRWFKAGGSHPRDVVGNLVEAVAHRQARRDLRDRKAGRLGGQRGAARHARVHLDHDHAAAFGIDRELDIRSAGVDADLADDPERGVAHDLVFLVGERLRGRHRDRVARMHAHRVEIFDRADDHDVVRHVAHHFELEFLPALDRLLDQHLVIGRHLHAPLDLGAILRRIARDRTSRAAERARGPDDERQAEAPADFLGLLVRARDAGVWHFQPDTDHRVLEEVAVLRLLDRGELGAD